MASSVRWSPSPSIVVLCQTWSGTCQMLQLLGFGVVCVSYFSIHMLLDVSVVIRGDLVLIIYSAWWLSYTFNS